MENQITNSTIKLAGAMLNNGNAIIDVTNVLLFLIFLALILVALSIFSYVKYKRDKNNVPDSTVVDKLKRDVAFYSSDFDVINNRLNSLEEKNNGIDAIHKAILEVKNLLEGGKRNV